MNINVDFGNIWDALSAIGTVGAVVLSLIFAYVKKKKAIKVNPTHDTFFGDLASLVISKSEYEQITITDFGYVRFRYRKKSLSNEGFYISYDGEREIANRVPFNFHSTIRIYITLYEPLKLKDGKKIQYYIKDIEGNTYKSPVFKHYTPKRVNGIVVENPK